MPEALERLVPLLQVDEIARAQRKLRQNFIEGAQPFPNRKVRRWTGVYWHKDLRVWGCLSKQREKRDGGRYFNAFGIDDPNDVGSNLWSPCEIRPAWQAPGGRGVAGLFAKDEDGRTYLFHSGRFRGLGPQVFLRHWRRTGGETAQLWNGKQTKEYALVAEIGAPSTPSQIASFVRHVANMKQGTKKPGTTPSSGSGSSIIPKGLSKDESEKSSVYERRGHIETRAGHGKVVNALRRELDRYNLRHDRDGKRDAYIISSSGLLLALFEVKTMSDTQPVYTGIGQLMMNGRAAQNDCKLVLVLPDGQPRENFLAQLKSLNVRLVKYAWHGDKVEFRGLERIVRALPATALRSR